MRQMILPALLSTLIVPSCSAPGAGPNDLARDGAASLGGVAPLGLMARMGGDQLGLETTTGDSSSSSSGSTSTTTTSGGGTTEAIQDTDGTTAGSSTTGEESGSSSTTTTGGPMIGPQPASGLYGPCTAGCGDEFPYRCYRGLNCTMYDPVKNANHPRDGKVVWCPDETWQDAIWEVGGWTMMDFDATACTRECNALSDCAPGPEGTTVGCVPAWENWGAAGYCQLVCETDADCPAGMACFPVVDAFQGSWVVPNHVCLNSHPTPFAGAEEWDACDCVPLEWPEETDSTG